MTGSRTLPGLVHDHAVSDPDRVILREVNGATLTWEDLDRGARAWSEALSAAGVKKGDTVATMMPHGFGTYFAWLGCSWLHAVEVPANLQYRAQWLRHVINLPKARYMVIAESYLERLEGIWDDLPYLETIIVFDGDAGDLALPFRVLGQQEFFSGVSNSSGGVTAAREVTPERQAPEMRDTACIIYTSGTSGPTKGVVVTWAMLHEAVTSSAPKAWGPEDVWYGTAPLFHVSGKSSLLVAAHFNSRLVVRETYSTSCFWDDIRQFGCTGAALVGAMVNYLYRQPPTPGDADTPLRYVRMTPLIEEWEDFAQRFGVDVYTAYGMTEFAPPINFGTPDIDRNHWRSCGRARDGFELRVVNDDDYPVAPGVVGSLVLRTDRPWLITPGYVGMAEETAKAWRNGWFHTNDAFTYDEDGYFYFQPDIKKKDMIRRRGENISAFEVEVAVRQYPDVEACKAVAVTSEWGEDEVKVVVVPKDGRSIDPPVLIEFLEPLMPAFAIPRYVQFARALSGAHGPGTSLTREQGPGAGTWDRLGRRAGDTTIGSNR